MPPVRHNSNEKVSLSCNQCADHSEVVMLHVLSGMRLVFGLILSIVTSLFFAFLKTFPLGVTFRVWLWVSIILWLGLLFSSRG